MTTPNKNGNGVAPVKDGITKTTALTVVKSEEKKEPETKKPEVVETPKPQQPLLPLEERLHRLNQLFELQGKYNQLQASLLKLKSFQLGKEDDTCRITFTDKNRAEFTTSNQFLMPKFLAFVKAEIETKMKEIEPLLKW